MKNRNTPSGCSTRRILQRFDERAVERQLVERLDLLQQLEPGHFSPSKFFFNLSYSETYICFSDAALVSRRQPVPWIEIEA